MGCRLVPTSSCFKLFRASIGFCTPRNLQRNSENNSCEGSTQGWPTRPGYVARMSPIHAHGNETVVLVLERLHCAVPRPLQWYSVSFKSGPDASLRLSPQRPSATTATTK